MRTVDTGWVRTLIALLLGCATLCGCWNFEGLSCRQVRDSADCELMCAPPWAAYADCFIDEHAVPTASAERERSDRLGPGLRR